MWRALRFGLVAVVLGTLAMSFLGVISFQNGDAMSTMHQRGVLKSFHEVLSNQIDDGTIPEADLSDWLNSHSINQSSDVTAMILDPSGKLVAASWGEATPEHAQLVLEKARESDTSNGFDRRVDIGMQRYVWFEGAPLASGHTLLLIHQCMNVAMPGVANLYILPIGLGILMIVWLGFWATVIAARMIRNQERVAAMELELVRQAEASRIKSAFFANMSHELRTPLNAIIGFSEMLKQEMFGPLGSDQNAGYVRDIHLAGKNLLNLVGNILEFSNIEAGDKSLDETEVDMRDVVDHVLEVHAPTLSDKNLQVNCNLDAIDCRLWGDNRKMQRALCNLVDNAEKYTPENGTIDISCREDRAGSICLEVRDNGPGISPEQLAKLSRGYDRTEENAHHAHDGPGLGIPLCRSIIALHGGSVTILSDVGKGTLVKVLLPKNRTIKASSSAPLPQMATAS